MIINIFTDASLNTQTLNAGYAFYIGCRANKIQRAGALQRKMKSTTLAELQAIINAVYMLRRAKLPTPSKVVIHTDSMECVKILQGSQQTPYDGYTRACFEECQFQLMDYLQSIGLPVYKYRMYVEFKHVKAHTGGTSKHSLINRWCDLESRRYREDKDISEGFKVKRRPNKK